MKEFEPFVQESGGVVMEVGSRDGHNAKEMHDIFKASRTITVEANPVCALAIQRDYPWFENHNVAIGAETGTVDFYAVREEFGPVILGQSSLLYKPSYDTIADKIIVNCLTMDDFVEAISVDKIEALKIDVEGATYELLQGFSNIRMTRLLHIESEHQQFWEGQHLYEDTVRFMEDAGYEQVYYQPVWTEQSDTIWLRRD